MGRLSVYSFIGCFIFFSTCRGEDDIAADYYFGVGVLRSNAELDPCKNSDFQMMCHIKCGGDHVCLNSKCYCFTSLTQTNGKLFPAQVEIQNSGDVSDNEEEMDEATRFLGIRPTLRHQIAHFCPNLSQARQCITKCMKEGKPAFCGKDHVCYCGHRDTHSVDVGGKLDVFKEYKDMYDKYILGLSNKT